MAYTLESASQKEVAARLSDFADIAEKTRSRQGLLGGVREDAKNPARAFSSAFLSAVADVDGRQFVNFDPASNASHAALQWAYENGGPGHKVSAALARIDEARLVADTEINSLQNRLADLDQKAQVENLPGEVLADYKKQYAEAENRIRTLEAEKESLRQTEKELASFGGQVNIYEPKASDSFGGRINTLYHLVEDEQVAARMYAERLGLLDGYDFAYRNPTAGPAEKVIASIGVGDIAEAFDVHLGPAIEHNGQIEVQGKRVQKAFGSKGYGLVKIIWGHGEGGNKRPDMPIVTRKDILALPEIVREYEPAKKAKTRVTWHIPREDGNLLIIAAEPMSETSGGQLVTMYVGKPGEGKGKLPVSEKRKSAVTNLSDDRFSLSEDTDRAIQHFNPGSRSSGLTGNSLSENRSPVNKKPMEVLQDLVDTVGVEIPESDKALFQRQWSDNDSAAFDARGAYLRNAGDGKSLIALFQGKADISTVIHEGAGHFFLENLREAAQLQNAPAWVREGWQDVARAIGADVNPGVPVHTDAHELFARMATEYFREGKAPNSALEKTFKSFARWLTKIWRAITRRGDFAQISPEVRQVMDKLLGTEDDLRARAARENSLALDAARK